jgi:hypothetical protein
VGSSRHTATKEHVLDPSHGGRIVAETFVGLMLGDSHSFLRQHANWAPNAQRKFTMADLIKTAIA